MSIPGKLRITKSVLLGMVFLTCSLFLALGQTNEVSKGAPTAADLWPDAEEEALATAVVYSTEYPGSLQIARHYLEKRKIPESNLIAISPAWSGGIQRNDYETLIEKPILEQLSKKGLLSPERSTNRVETASPEIRYLVLCRGVPFVIYDKRRQPDSKKQCGAAVDSELASVFLRKHPKDKLPPLDGLEGFLPNEAAASQVTPSQMGPKSRLLMVARLDGPSDEIAMGLVDKALRAEEEGLWGQGFFDIRGLKDPVADRGYLVGDLWLRRAVFCWRAAGMDFIIDEQAQTIAAEQPLASLAYYAGWYDWNASGPFAQALTEFVPGAFAYHLHSFSAQDIYSTTNHWVGPLLNLGATCTVGYVDEPFLGQTLNVGIFTEWFLKGASFGEAAYHALPGLSWQATVVGDPLYRPFRVAPIDRFVKTFNEYPHLAGWGVVQSANLNLLKGMDEEKVLKYIEGIYKDNPMDWALGQWLIRFYAKEEEWKKALGVSQNLIDQSREMTRVQRCWTMLQKAQAESKLKKYKEANQTYKALSEEYAPLRRGKDFLAQWENAARRSSSKADLEKIRSLQAE
jgi:uncharacterized protein (TIGR03790 family)